VAPQAAHVNVFDGCAVDMWALLWFTRSASEPKFIPHVEQVYFFLKRAMDRATKAVDLKDWLDGFKPCLNAGVRTDTGPLGRRMITTRMASGARLPVTVAWSGPGSPRA
jgi:hypothetical protein